MKQKNKINLDNIVHFIGDKLKDSFKRLLKKNNELIFLICDSLLLAVLNIAPLKNKKTIKKVCVRLDGLGDAIIFINYINANNKDEVLYIVSNLQESFVKNLKNVKHYFVIDRVKFKINIFYRFKILSQINRMQCDEIINPVFSKEILLEDSVVRFIRSKNKIGVLGNLENSSPFFNYIGNKFYDQLLKINHNESIHDFHLNHEIIKLTTNSSATLYHSPINFNTFFVSRGKNIDYSNHIIVNSGSRQKSRNLPEIYYYKIIKYILSNSSQKIILTGHSLYEKHLCNRIEEKFGDKIVNLHGKTSIPDIFDIASSCKKVITNDTFMVHASNMLDCKTIMFKKQSITYNRFLPYPDSFPSNNMKKVFLLNDDLYNNFEEVFSSIDILLGS
jgi:ADP-heptose:LPS heptosyltransferase